MAFEQGGDGVLRYQRKLFVQMVDDRITLIFTYEGFYEIWEEGN